MAKGDDLVGTDLKVDAAHKDDAHKAPPDPKPKSKIPGSQELSGNAPVFGTKGAVSFPDGAGKQLTSGDAGFSRHMLAATNAYANELDGWDQLRNVLPSTRDGERQVRQRGREKQEQLDKSEEWGMTPSTKAIYTNAAAWCDRHGTTIKQDIENEKETFTRYNAWLPLANAFYGSKMRLKAQEKLLGVTDTGALVQQLSKGVDDAGQVAARMQLAHDKGTAPALTLPAIDGSLTEAGIATTAAARQMNTAYLGFQQHLLEVEKDTTNHEGDKDSARLAQINENKAFVRNVGKTIDVAMSVIDGAPGAISTATTKMNQVGAKYGAMANKRQIMNGMRQTHNPTYIALDAQGNQVVRNLQTGTDRAMTTKAGEPYATTPTPEPEGATLPTSVSDVMGKIVDFAYASEVKKINFHLETIKTHCGMIQAAGDAAKTRQQIQTFQDSLNTFAERCAFLQKRMEARRDQYLEFGVALDNFARTDQGAQKAGLSPTKGGERYASIMTMVSTIREMLSLGRGAAQSFESTRELTAWAHGIYVRREDTSDGRSDIGFTELPTAELQSLVDMWTQVKHFEDSYSAQSSTFKGVDEAAQKALDPLSQGGGRGGSY